MSIACQSWEVGSGPTVGCCKAQAAHHPHFRKLLCRPDATAAKFMQQQHQQQHQAAQAHAQVFPPKLRLPRVDEAEPKVDVVVPPCGAAAAGAAVVVAPVVVLEACSSSSSLVTSSVSNDSSEESDEKEVQSAFKGPLEQMDTLMTTLPRRGLSKFYAGKSRSFTSLADVKSMSMKELSKPDNPYAKRRRLPVHREVDKPRFPPPRMSNGISKRPTSSNGTTLTLALAMSTRGDGLVAGAGAGGGGGDECLATTKRWQKSCRSFSLTDLQKV